MASLYGTLRGGHVTHPAATRPEGPPWFRSCASASTLEVPVAARSSLCLALTAERSPDWLSACSSGKQAWEREAHNLRAGRGVGKSKGLPGGMI